MFNHTSLQHFLLAGRFFFSPFYCQSTTTPKLGMGIHPTMQITVIVQVLLILGVSSEELPHPACSINIKPKRSLKLSILHLRFVQEKGALITCMQLKNG